MRPASEVLPTELPLVEALARVRESSEQTRLSGSTRPWVGDESTAECQRGKRPGEACGALSAAGRIPYLHADHSLDVALDRMGALHLDLRRWSANVHELLSCRAGDVLEAYGLAQKEGKLESPAATATESTTESRRHREPDPGTARSGSHRGARQRRHRFRSLTNMLG
jgi:hypothetical protein